MSIFGQQLSIKANNNSGSIREKRDRLLKIEQKLQAITLHKQNLVKDETQEQLTRRVIDIQQKCNEEIRQMENKVRQIKEGLVQMKLREADLSKKCELSRKLRINSIKSLQKTLGNLLSQEFKQRRELEITLFSILQQKDRQLVEQLALIKETRIQTLNKFEEQLAQNIPQTHFRIAERLQEIEINLQCLHRKIRTEVQQLQKKMKQQQIERQKGLKNIVDFIIKTTEQIRVQIEQEKKSRQNAKLKILHLFENAYGKLRLL